MKAGWKNRIEERRYFEEKKSRVKQKPKLNELNAYEQMLYDKQKEHLGMRPITPYFAGRGG